MNLTPKQLRIFKFIRDFRESHSYAPTLVEIARAFDISKITVLQHLRALEKRGAIRRRRYQARSIELREKPSERLRPIREIPLVGTIAACEPIEAVEDQELMDFAGLLEGKVEPFLLRVRGNSMIDEQIRDGDYVICERRSIARNGETAVAILNNGEATLKKFFREPAGANGQGDCIGLQPARRPAGGPAHPNMPPLYPEQVEIRGVVIGVLRKY